MTDGRQPIILPTRTRDQPIAIPPRNGSGLPDIPDVPPPPLVAPTTPGISPTSTSRLLTAQAASRPLPLVYGRQNLGGQFVWGTSLGGNLLLVFWLCEGPIAGVDTITFNGTSYTDLGCTATIYTGTSTQTVDPSVAAQLSTYTSGLPGTAYVVLQVPAPTAANASFDPLSPVFVVRGRMVRDPRLDPTLVTRYYSVNPALCTADFMTLNRAGMGVKDAYIDWSGTLTTAANDAEASTGRPTAPTSGMTVAWGAAPGNMASGTYYYTVTFVNSSGVESVESPTVSVTIGATFSSAAIGAIPIGPGGTTARRIYRCTTQTGSLAPRFLVTSINDNTTTSWIDVLADSMLGPGPQTSSQRYTMNITLSQQADVNATLQNLRANWNGFIIFNNGLYQFFVDKMKSNSGLTYTNDPANAGRNVIGPFTHHLKLTEEVPTRVEATFVNASKSWADDLAIAEFPGVTTGVYPKIVLQIEIRGTDNYDQAQRIANQVLNNGLNDKQATVLTNFEGIRAMIMDRVTYTDAIANISYDALLLGIKPQTDGSYLHQIQIYSDSTYSDVVQSNSPSGSGPLINPNLAPGDIPAPSLLDASTGSAPYGSLYWQSARLYSLQLWPSASWTPTGLFNYTGSAVNDGVASVKAFDAAAAADASLYLDVGSGLTKTMGKCQIFFTAAPTSNVQWLVEYSDNATTWTNTNAVLIAGALMTTTYTLEWADAGAHRYWRIHKGAATAETAANYSDVQFFACQPDPLISHYEIFDNSGATPRYFISSPGSPLPTLSNPINCAPLVTGASYSGQSYNIMVRAVRFNGLSSIGVARTSSLSPSGAQYPYVINGSSLVSGSAFYVSTGKATLFGMPYGTDLTLANGANNNVAITNSSHRIIGPSAAANITGIAAGFDGQILVLYNTTAWPITLSYNNAGSSAANRIYGPGGVDYVMAATLNATILQYNGAYTHWLVLDVPSTGGSGISTSFGADASAPAAGSTGNLYLDNDGLRLRRDNGSSYDSIGPIYPLSDAMPAFAWRNQGTRTVATTYGGEEVTAPATVATSVGGREIAIPATPYSISAAFVATLPSAATRGFGLYLTDGTKLILYWLGGGSITTGGSVLVDEWTNVTTFNVNSHTTGMNVFMEYGNLGAGNLLFLRIADDGTTLYYEYSWDGIHFQTAYSDLHHAYLTATNIGWFVYNQNAGGAGITTAYARLIHWKQTASAP